MASVESGAIQPIQEIHHSGPSYLKRIARMLGMRIDEESVGGFPEARRIVGIRRIVATISPASPSVGRILTPTESDGAIEGETCTGPGCRIESVRRRSIGLLPDGSSQIVGHLSLLYLRSTAHCGQLDRRAPWPG
jgi:hypothetical protein